MIRLQGEIFNGFLVRVWYDEQKRQNEIYSPNPFNKKETDEYSILEDLRVKVDKKKVILVIKNKDRIMKQLNTYGINRMRIYPEIDEVSGYIKNYMMREA